MATRSEKSAQKMPEARKKAGKEYAKKNVPSNCRGLYQRTLTGKAAPAGAIKAHCQHCFGYTNVVEEIRGCSSKICPLWNYRPYQNTTKQPEGDNDEEPNEI